MRLQWERGWPTVHWYTLKLANEFTRRIDFIKNSTVTRARDARAALVCLPFQWQYALGNLGSQKEPPSSNIVRSLTFLMLAKILNTCSNINNRCSFTSVGRAVPRGNGPQERELFRGIGGCASSWPVEWLDEKFTKRYTTRFYGNRRCMSGIIRFTQHDR